MSAAVAPDTGAAPPLSKKRSRISWSDSARARHKAKTQMADPHNNHSAVRLSMEKGPGNQREANDAGNAKRRTVHLELPVLPCWDEDDNGVPNVCEGEPHWWKVFNHDNKLTNFNPLCMIFGNVGFEWYDHRRKQFMAMAMWSTLLSIGFTIYGCFAISTSPDIVKACHWFSISVKQVGDVEGGFDHMTPNGHSLVYVGLSSLVTFYEPCTVNGCAQSNLRYDELAQWNNTFLDDDLTHCRQAANDFVFGAFVTCATLGFALLGIVNRMKFSADAPIQKALGMVTDLCGFISLLHTLLTLGDNCFTELNDSHFDGLKVSVQLGPGFWCYGVCLFGALMRVLGHWLTPLPGQGSGCACKVPEHVHHLLDVDGDGQITHKDFIAVFRSSRHDTDWQARVHEARRFRRDSAAIAAYRSNAMQLPRTLSEKYLPTVPNVPRLHLPHPHRQNSGGCSEVAPLVTQQPVATSAPKSHTAPLDQPEPPTGQAEAPPQLDEPRALLDQAKAPVQKGTIELPPVRLRAGHPPPRMEITSMED